MSDTPSATKLPIEQLVPANHLVRLLQDVAAEPAGNTVMQLSGAGMPEPELPLAQALRAALLQACYCLPDHQQFADHLRFNTLFRCFVGLQNEEEPWDSALYAHLYERLTNDQELQRFFEIVAAAARAKKQAEYTVIANALDRWVTTYCPKARGFHYYPKCPLKEVMLTMQAHSQGLQHPVFPARILYGRLKATFPDYHEFSQHSIDIS